jgi:DNA-binding transcriptional regulator PaaX
LDEPSDKVERVVNSKKEGANRRKRQNDMEENKGQILLYQTPDGESRIEVTLQGETVWLSLDQMAELFQRNKSTISRHIKNVLEEGELNADSTVAFFATVHGNTCYLYLSAYRRPV